MRDIQLDLGHRTAVVRGPDPDSDRLALILAASSKLEDLVSHYLGAATRRNYAFDSMELEMNPRAVLDLGPLALIPGYLESLGKALSRRIRLTPRLATRLKRIAGLVKVQSQPLKSDASQGLLERARPYQAWLEGQGFELWPVQIRDAAVLAARGGGLLAFEPRLGKTRTAYGACLARGIRRTLVVADSAPLQIWGSELPEVFGLAPEQVPLLTYARDIVKKGLPSGRKAIRALVQAKVAELIAKAGDRPLALGVSFHLMASEPIQRPSKYAEYPVAKEILRAFRPGAVIVDEAHHASDRATRHGHILSLLRARVTIAVTGTPTNGRLENQNTLPAWLSARWGHVSYPWRRHVRWPGASWELNCLGAATDSTGNHQEERVVSQRASAGNEGVRQVFDHLRWHERTRHLLIERSHDDPKVKASHTRAKAEHSVVKVDMDFEHERFYQSLVEEMALVAKEAKELEKTARTCVPSAGLTPEQWEREVDAWIRRARGLLHKRFSSSYHRLSIGSACPWDARLCLPDGTRFLKRTSKYRKILELARTELAAGEKVVILTHHRAYSDALLADLAGEGVLDCTAGLTAPEKKALQDRFWSDPTARVLVLNGAAAGEGYDFAAASVMLVGDLDERLIKLTQAMFRIAGPRQTKVPRVMHVVHTLTAPKGCQVSVDEETFARLTVRKAMADLALSAREVADMDDWEARATRLTG